VTVPEGTRILIRTIAPLDPSKQCAGQLFGGVRAGRTKGEKARVAAGVGLGALLGGAIGIGKAAGAGVAAGTAAISAGNLSGELSLPPTSLIEFRLEKPATIPVATK
jgi:hypothetical protein